MLEKRTWPAAAPGAVLALALPVLAHAGDIASLQVIGFSPDAKVFAYEEYGVQDGSGFPYSNIYFVDTSNDSYLKGTPFRVRIDQDMTSIAAARDKARQQAQDLIAQYHLAENPGILAAYNPVSEAGSDPLALSYLTVQSSPAFTEPYTLKLEPIPFQRPDKCKDLTEHYGGFRLLFTQVNGKAASATAYEDKSVPASRGCVSSYRLGGMVLTGKGSGPHIAMVEVDTFGFEGNDGRWIAVPLRPAN